MEQAHYKAGLSGGRRTCLVLVALLKPHLPNALMKCGRSSSWTLACQDLCSQKVLPSGRKETSIPVLLFPWKGTRQGQSCLVWAL